MDPKIKSIGWIAIACTAILSLTGLLIFGDAEARSYVDDVIAFLAGLLIPGSPLGRFFGSGGGPRPPSAPLAGAALLMLGVLLLGVVLTGCAPSALRTHRMAAGLTGIALTAGRDALATVGDEVLERCGADEACRRERENDLADAAAAFDLADVARASYSVAIDVAREVGEGDYIAAVGEGAMGLLRAYYRVRAFLCRLGVELPEPPRLLVDAVRWAAGESVGDVPPCVLAVED